MNTARFTHTSMVGVALLAAGCPELAELPLPDEGMGGALASGGALAAGGPGGAGEAAGGAPPGCLPPEPVWRRPGGYWNPAAGADPDRAPAVVANPEPDADPESGFSAFHSAFDACGRQVSWGFDWGCTEWTDCEHRVRHQAAFDPAGRLTSIEYSSTWVPENHSIYSIRHTYDAQGARLATSGRVLPDGASPLDAAVFTRTGTPPDATWAYGIGEFTYVNDEQGRLVEEVADVAGELVFEQPVDGLPDRRSRFTWDDAAGTVTESIDLGDDGVIDEVRVWPQSP